MGWLRPTALVAGALVWPYLGVASERVLTREDALALARERAPLVLAARARIDEARGRLLGASVRLRENPVLDIAGGRRTSDGDSFTEFGVGLSQTFELGRRRGSRIQAAQADVTRAQASSRDAERRLLRDVAVAFDRALHAEERLRLASATEEIAAEVLRTAERRRDAGDAPTLEVNLVKASLGRARSDVLAAQAGRAAGLGELRLLLGLDADEPVAVRGNLDNRQHLELAELLARIPERADLQAVEADVQEAEAEVRLGEGLRWPDLGIGGRYEREEGADVVLGTLLLRLPIFERGQGFRAEAGARARRLRLELDAGRRAVATEVHAAFEVYRRRVESVEKVEVDVLPLVDSNESMARRAYEEGQLGIGDLLLVRRETLESRTDYLDRLLEAAVAASELEASVGVP